MLGWRLRGLVALCILLLLGACNPGAPSGAQGETAAKPVGSVDSVAEVPVRSVDSFAGVLDTLEVPPEPDALVLECKFVEMQWGDYAHLVVRDDAGKTRSFYLADDLPEGDYLEFEGTEHKGKRIVVKWRKVKKNIPEGGGVRSVEEAYSIELK